MKYLKFLLFILGFTGLLGGVGEYLKLKYPKVEVKEPEVVVDPQVVTREFADKVMSRCRATLSPTRREILTSQIVRVTHQRFTKEEDRQAFMALLCIESGFNPLAKSPVGATGVAQLMPQYGQEFAKLCGYEGVDTADIQDTEVNLQLGSCLFNHLIKETGNVYIAMAAYNSGLQGATTKNLKALKGGGSPETINYVNRIAVLKESVKNETTIYATVNAGNK